MRINKQLGFVRNSRDRCLRGKRPSQIENIQITLPKLVMLAAWAAQEKASIRRSFKSIAECWNGEDVAEDAAPFSSVEDVWRALLALIGGLVCLIPDSALSAFIFHSSYGVPLWVGLVFPALIVVIVHSLFHLSFEVKGEPQTTMERYRRYVLIPGAIGFGLCLALILGVRVADLLPDAWAELFEDALEVNLLTLSFSTALLASGFLGCAHLSLWTWRMPRKYEALTRLEQEIEQTRNILEADLIALTGGHPTPPPVRPVPTPEAASHGKSHFVNGAIKNVTAALLVVTLALPLTYWAPLARAAESCPELHLFLDHSGSTFIAGLKSAAAGFVADLPELVDALDICKIKAFSFAANGWQASTILDVTIPQYADPQREALKTKHIDIVAPKLAEKRQERAERKYAAAQEAARAAHAKAVQAALAAVSVEALTTSSLKTNELGCSSIQDSLQRVRSIQADAPVYVLYFSDMEENCIELKALRLVPPPVANVTAVAVILGEEVGMVAQRVNRKGQAVSDPHLTGGFDELEERRARLRKIAPWVAAHSQHEIANYTRLFSKARPVNP